MKASGDNGTGLTVAVRRCIDGTFAAATGTVTEDSLGAYKFALSQADTNGNDITLWFTSSTMISVCVNFVTTSLNPYDAVRGGMTALPNANAEASGGLYTRGTGAGQINQTNNGQIDANAARTGGTTNTGRDIGASVLLSSGTGTGQLDFTSGVVKSNLTQMGGVAQSATDLKDFADTGYDPATHKVQGVVLTDTATNLTNAPTNGDLTATMKTSVTTAATAATPIAASVTGNVGGNVVGSVGSVATGGISAASFAAGAIDAAALAADAVQEIWSHPVATGSITLTAEAALAIAASGGLGTFAVNDASATTTSFVTTLTSSVDDFYRDMQLQFTSGALSGQIRVVSAYVGSTKTVTLDEALTSAPADTVTFVVSGPHTHTVGSIAAEVWQDTTAGDFTVAGSIGKSLFTSGNAPGAASGLALVGDAMTLTSAYDAAKTAAQAATALSTATWTATRAGYLDNLNVGGLVAPYAYLVAFFQLALRKDSWLPSDLAAFAAVLNANTGGGAGSFSNTTDAQQAIRDEGDAAWITATGFATVNPDNAGIAAIEAVTDQFVFTIPNQVDANALSGSITVGDVTLAAAQPNYAPATVAALATAQADLDTLTGADGATLATLQGNYAPAKAGDTMQQDMTQAVPTSNTAQTVGDALNAARAQGFGKWQIVGTTLSLYAADGTTVVKSFTLDSTATPTSRT